MGVDPCLTRIRIVNQIERVDRPADVIERQLVIVRSADTGTGAFDDFLCDISETSAVVYAALLHQIFLPRRIDPETEKRILVVRLLLTGDHDDFDLAGIEDDRRPHIHQ